MISYYLGLPEFKPDELKLPVQFRVDSDGVKAYQDGKFIGLINEVGENRFEYVPDKQVTFTFQKDGYQPITKTGTRLKSREEVKMARVPQRMPPKDLEEPLSNAVLYDERATRFSSARSRAAFTSSTQDAGYQMEI